MSTFIDTTAHSIFLTLIVEYKMIDPQPYISAATQELNKPTFELTKQHLQVMEIELENGYPKVARVNLNHYEDTVAVYFHIKNERFFLVVNVAKSSIPNIKWIWVESGHRVYLTATTETLSYEDLSSILPYGNLSGWSKGDLQRNNKLKYNFTRISYEPNMNEAYGLEEKLLELLKELEKEADSIRELTKKAKTYISVCKHQYISANAGILLDLETLSRLSALNLALDIDTYICGQEIE
ncbi:DUF4279 domain-containing protein [Microbulbifer sp. JTAC008]|uniref:DUF4279 domain-containing protein n=1 Tax=unclassified Microbulbifer TaxID=2619833 RepID=UPI004039B183